MYLTEQRSVIVPKDIISFFGDVRVLSVTYKATQLKLFAKEMSVEQARPEYSTGSNKSRMVLNAQGPRYGTATSRLPVPGGRSSSCFPAAMHYKLVYRSNVRYFCRIFYQQLNPISTYSARK